jgi:Tfp pilus assembly protein PilE
MSVTPETKRLGRTVAVVAAVGLLLVAALSLVAYRMYQSAVQRRVAAANESAAIAALEGIAAAQHLYFQTHGRYATFPQLVEEGIFRAPLSGDALVSRGYTFTLKLMPGAEGQTPFYSVNADPVREGESGRRHFYIDSDVTGLRVSEGRPANASDPPRLSVEQF